MPSQRDQLALAEHLLQVAIRAAREGAAFIRERTPDLERIDWQVKSRADFVTEVDTGAEERIAAVLTREVPDASVIGEELSPGLASDSGIAFIVDPLDGTTNFLHGYPQYAVSIAARADGHLLAGVVLHVPCDSLYSARLGGGAYRDGEPIRVSRTTEPQRALVGTGFPFKHPGLLEPYLPQFARITSSTAGVRRTGSAALDLADVACGRFDAFWELMIAPWDMAAGMLLVREGGGRITDLNGTDIGPSHSGVVASNGVMHEWMMRQVNEGVRE